MMAVDRRTTAATTTTTTTGGTGMGLLDRLVMVI
jgi:lysyl-tRNA synthetase class II